MYKIIVKNTCIIITDYTLGDKPRLERMFSIYDVITHRLYSKGMYYDEVNRLLYLPRGIDIWIIEKMFNETAHVEKNSYTHFDTYDDIKVKYLPRDEVQTKAIKFMVGKDEYSDTISKSQLCVNLNTGKGKTYCSIATISIFGIKSAIITYAVNVLEQWKNCILEYTNLKPKEIYTISGAPCIVRLFNKTPEELKVIKIFLIPHGTLKSYGDKNGWSEITRLFEHLRIGMKFYDEAHLNFDNMCMIDYYTNVYRTYYVTATPARSDLDENRIYHSAFKNVLSIDLFDKDTDPHTKYMAIKYTSNPSPQIISYCKNAYGLDRAKYTNWVITNPNFLKMATVVLDLALKLAKDEKDQILIYIKTNAAIDLFYAWLLVNFPQYSVGKFNSTVSAEEKVISLTKKIILSTTLSTGAAIDIRNLKVTIVLAEPFVSEVLARQTLGRTRNTDTYYIDIVDYGFRQCVNYFNRKKPIFNKYASDCSVSSLSNVELNEKYNNIVKVKEQALNCLTVPFTILSE